MSEQSGQKWERSPTSVSKSRKNNGGKPQRYRGHKSHADNRYVTKREMKGGMMNVPSNPPIVSYQPWFSTTVVHAGVSGDITIKVSDLITQLVQQLDPTQHGFKTKKDGSNVGGAILNIRIRSIRAWNLTGRMIALTVDDYSDADKAIADVDALCGIVDTGSQSHIPAIGFEMPESHKNIVLRNGTDSSSDKDAVLYHIVSPSSDTCIIYTSIFWKFDGPAKFTSFHNSMLTSVQQIERNVFHIENNVGKILDIATQEDSKNKGDYGNLVVDGITKIAPYVISAAAANESIAPQNQELLERIQQLEDKLRDLACGSDDYSICGSPQNN